MTILFILLMIIGGVGVWFYTVRQPDKQKRNYAFLFIGIIFLGFLIQYRINENSGKKPTDKQVQQFASYFDKHANIKYNKNKVTFKSQGDSEQITIILSNGYKTEKKSRKLELGKDFKNQKDTLFNKWVKNKKLDINTKKYTPKLVIAVSDKKKTIIVKEVKNDLEIEKIKQE